MVSTCLDNARLASDHYESTTETAVDGVALLVITCIFEKFRGTLDFMNPPHPTISSAYAVDMVTHSKIQKFISAAILLPYYPYFQTSSNTAEIGPMTCSSVHACFAHVPIPCFNDHAAMCKGTTDTYDRVQSMCMLSTVCLFS